MIFSFKASRTCKNRLFRHLQTLRFMEENSPLPTYRLDDLKVNDFLATFTLAQQRKLLLHPWIDRDWLESSSRFRLRLIANFRLKKYSSTAFRRCVDGERWRETEHWTDSPHCQQQDAHGGDHRGRRNKCFLPFQNVKSRARAKRRRRIKIAPRTILNRESVCDRTSHQARVHVRLLRALDEWRESSGKNHATRVKILIKLLSRSSDMASIQTGVGSPTM